MIEAALAGLDQFLTLKALLYLGLGSIIGLVFGAIPGLGGTTALALLIPLTFGMDSFAAISLFGGVMGAVPFGGSLTAILLNTPGVAINAATCFDGYPMAQAGRAGPAIGAAGAASALGGLLGVGVLVAVMPAMREIVLLFGPPEFLILALLGLSAVAVATHGQIVRGLLMGGVGFMLALVGFDKVHGGVRYTFDLEYLWDGVQLVPALIGLFAIAEIINLSVRGGSIAAAGANTRIHGVWEGVVAVFRNWVIVLRGSAIGAFIGAVPGVGGTVASFLSYSVTVQLSGEPETFGKGNIKGVIAPESSNNAKDGGSLIPTLAFGIPGGAEMAVFLGALVLHGMQPGPQLLLDHSDIIFTLIFALSASCVVASLIGMVSARWLIRITELDAKILAIVVPVVALVGAYALRSSFGDVITAMVFGIAGYLMIRFDYPRLTLVIALVLGEIAEVSYFQTGRIIDDEWLSMFLRPGVAVLSLLTIATLAVPVVQFVLARRRAKDGPEIEMPPVRLSSKIFGGVVLVVSAAFVAQSYAFDFEERIVPLLIGYTTILFVAIDLLSMSGSRIGRAVNGAIGGGAGRAVEDRLFRQELNISIWLAAVVAGAYLVGFLVIIPVFAFFSMLRRGRYPLRHAIAMTIGLFAVIWVGFELLLGYELYRGILFGGY